MTSEDVYVPNTDFCIDGPKSNPKQIEFLQAAHSGLYRYLAYGGSVRGGKSYVVLFTLHTLCMTYPGSKWAVVRASRPVLQKTTIPSFNKLIKTEKFGEWRLSTPITFTYRNGSEIIFIPESIQDDPMLNSFLGLEVNGFFLEQAEELSEKIWERALERSGSWYLPKMPPALIMTTFNPTQTWPKQRFYEPWVKNELPDGYLYLPASPKDNPHVTNDQWSNWNAMGSRFRAQMIEGDWTDFDGANNRWAYSFNDKKHIGRPELNIAETVYLSFDFNRNPICCSVIQWYNSQVKVIETIKLANSDIYRLCEYILVKYPNCAFQITGDATGKNSSAMVQDDINYYYIISSKLDVDMNLIDLPSVNPTLQENRVLVNALLENYPSIEIHEENASALIYDLRNCTIKADGTINKGDRNDPKQQWDAIDTFRYFCNTYLKGFIIR